MRFRIPHVTITVTRFEKKKKKKKKKKKTQSVFFYPNTDIYVADLFHPYSQIYLVFFNSYPLLRIYFSNIGTN